MVSGSASTAISMRGVLAEQARADIRRDALEIGVDLDRPERARFGDHVVELGDGADARLHGAIALQARIGRPPQLVGDERGDDLQAVLDAVRQLGGEHIAVTIEQGLLGGVFEDQQQLHS